jgi:hypothetical protein
MVEIRPAYEECFSVALSKSPEMGDANTKIAR